MLEFAGHREVVERKLIPGRDYSEDIAKVAETIGHLNTEIAIGTATRKDVSKAREALDQANAELARLAALEPVAARVEPVRTGKLFREHWESLDTAGKNAFLRSADIRAVASRDERPTRPSLSSRLGSMVIIDEKDMHLVIDLGNLGELLERASAA